MFDRGVNYPLPPTEIGLRKWLVVEEAHTYFEKSKRGCLIITHKRVLHISKGTTNVYLPVFVRPKQGHVTVFPVILLRFHKSTWHDESPETRTTDMIADIIIVYYYPYYIHGDKVLVYLIRKWMLCVWITSTSNSALRMTMIHFVVT